MGTNVSTNKINHLKKTPSLNNATATPESPLDVDVEHLEIFTLVWLDRHNGKNEQIETLQQRLRQHVAYLITFDDPGLCEEWLKTRPIDDKILLITPGQLGKKLVPDIHQLTSIIGIYVFCLEVENHQIWTQNYSKIRAVICKSEMLMENISKDQIYFDNIEASKAIKIFNGPAHTRVLDLANTPFIYYQLLLEILISPFYLLSPASPTELIQILRRSCSNDPQGLILIKQFESTYSKTDPLKLLIDNTPLARFLTKALREENISMLFYLRFFLIDIYNQLIKYQLQSAHVYRKQIMSLNDIENIRVNINNYLMFNEFLYTSTKQSEIPLVDTNENQLQTVYIEIQAERKDETAPFRYIQSDGESINSKILFMCGSIFKIVSLSRDTNTSWTLRLSLAESKELNVLADQKQKLRQNKDLLMIVELLDQSNQSDKANVYCQHLLRELPANHILVPQLREQMNTDTKAQPVALQRIQIILLDLSTRLTPLASAMLDVLHRLTNNSILICESPSNIDFDRMSTKTILLFASSQAKSLITNKPTRCFILEDNGYTDNEVGHFTNSEDLIFELADELYSTYKWESDEHLRVGDNILAKEKIKVANQIHSELKKVYQKLSTNNNDNKPSISATIAIVYLKSRDNDTDNLEKIQRLFKDIISLCLMFDDEDDCFSHVCSTYYNHSIFLIIDHEYKDASVLGLPLLSNVKRIYHNHQSSSTPPIKEAQNVNDDKFSMRLAHDLISHYNQLGAEFEERNDPNKAKDMFLKASQLCELLINICVS